MIQINVSQIKEKVVESCKFAVIGLQNPRKLAEGLDKITPFQWLEVAAVVLVLFGVGYVVSLNSGFWLGKTAEKPNIMVWIDRPALPKPPAPPPPPPPPPGRRGRPLPPPPVAVARVIIPKGYTVTTVFDSADGRLEFREITGGYREPLKHSMAFFAGNNLTGFEDEWTRLRKVPDPARRMMMLAAIGVADQRPWTLPTEASLSADQQTAATAIEGSLKDDLGKLNDSVIDGSFEPALREKAFSAMANYFAQAGVSEEAKSAAAKATMQAGMAYAARIEESREKAMQKYVDDMDKLLDAAQHSTLGEIANELATGRKSG